MPIDLELIYKPLSELPADPSTPVELSLGDHRKLVEQSGLVDLVNQVVIDPFEETLKSRNKDEFNFGELRIGRKVIKRKDTSWKEVQQGLDNYLSVRADDARAGNTEGVLHVEGVGYCMPAADIVIYVEKLEKDNTSPSESARLSWPKPGIAAPTRRLFVPGRLNYSKPSNETAAVVQEARIFRSGVEKEVIERYKQIQKRWLQQQTGFDENNIPPVELDTEQTPTKIWRRLGPNVYTVVNIVREERTAYAEAIKTFVGELKELAVGRAIEGYRCSRSGQTVLVNIKTAKDRLEKIYADNKSLNVRYEMSP